MNPKAKPMKSTILVTRISGRLLPPINAISGVLPYKYCIFNLYNMYSDIFGNTLF